MPGCSLGGGGSDQVAADAAAAYQADLDAFAHDLKAAIDDGKGVDAILADPPQLEQIDTEDDGYATAAALADRVDPMVAELSELEVIDDTKMARLFQDLYTKSVAQASDALKAGTQHLTASNRNAITAINGDQAAADAAEHKLDTGLMKAQIEDWRAYERSIERLPKTELARSFVGYQVHSADQAIDLYTEYLEHLRDNSPGRAQFAYYDDLWPHQRPFNAVGAGVFVSIDDPYIKSLRKAEPIIRSLTQGIARLAQANSVGPNSPSVGDGYREQIVKGFVSPLAEDKLVGRKVAFRGWMLYRISELEDTPAKAYNAAEQTLMLELVDDQRNAYSQLLAGLAGADELGIVERDDVPGLVAYVELMNEKLTEPYPPILERTRDDFLEAVNSIDVESARDAYDDGRPDFDEIDMISDAFDSQQRAQRKMEDVMLAGAKRIDDPKQLKQALTEAVEATRP